MISTLARQGGSFALVGGVATLMHGVMSLTAASLLDLAPLPASVLGYLCAVGISYLGNALLTFRAPVADRTQFLRFVLISLAGLGLNLVAVYLLSARAHLPFKIAMIPVMVLVPTFSFILSKLWVFRARPAAT